MEAEVPLGPAKFQQSLTEELTVNPEAARVTLHVDLCLPGNSQQVRRVTQLCRDSAVTFSDPNLNIHHLFILLSQLRIASHLVTELHGGEEVLGCRGLAEEQAVAVLVEEVGVEAVE